MESHLPSLTLIPTDMLPHSREGTTAMTNSRHTPQGGRRIHSKHNHQLPNTGAIPSHPVTTKAENSLVWQQHYPSQSHPSQSHPSQSHHKHNNLDTMRRNNRQSTKQRITRELEGGLSRDVSYSDRQLVPVAVAGNGGSSGGGHRHTYHPEEDDRLVLPQLLPTPPPSSATLALHHHPEGGRTTGYGTLQGEVEEGTLVSTKLVDQEQNGPAIGKAAYQRQIITQAKEKKKQSLLKMTLQEVESSFLFDRPDSVHYKSRAHPGMLLVDEQPGSLRKRLLKNAAEISGSHRHFAVRTLVPQEYYQYEATESPFEGTGRTPGKKLLFPTSTPTSRGEVLLLADALEVMAKKVLAKYPANPSVTSADPNCVPTAAATVDTDGSLCTPNARAGDEADLMMDEARGAAVEQQHSERLSSTLSVLDIVFVEVIRQVACACVERGFLLEHIRECIFACVKEVSVRETKSIQKVQDLEIVIEKQRRDIIGLSDTVEELSGQCRSHLLEKQRLARMELATTTSHSKERVLHSIRMLEEEDGKVQNVLLKANVKSATSYRQAAGGLFSDHDTGSKTALAIYGSEGGEKRKRSVFGKLAYGGAGEVGEDQNLTKNPFKTFFEDQEEIKSSIEGSQSARAPEPRPSNADQFAKLGRTMSIFNNRFLKDKHRDSKNSEGQVADSDKVECGTSTSDDPESEEATWRRRYHAEQQQQRLLNVSGESSATTHVLGDPFPDGVVWLNSQATGIGLLSQSQSDSSLGDGARDDLVVSQAPSSRTSSVVGAGGSSRLPSTGGPLSNEGSLISLSGITNAVSVAKSLGAKGKVLSRSSMGATSTRSSVLPRVASKIMIERCGAQMDNGVQCDPIVMHSKETQCFPKVEPKVGRDRGTQCNVVVDTRGVADVFMRLGGQSINNNHTLSHSPSVPAFTFGEKSRGPSSMSPTLGETTNGTTTTSASSPRFVALPQKSSKTQTDLCLKDLVKLLDQPLSLFTPTSPPRSSFEDGFSSGRHSTDTTGSSTLVSLEPPPPQLSPPRDPQLQNFYEFHTKTDKFAKLKPKSRTNRWFLGATLDICTWLSGKDTHDLTAASMARLLIDFFRNRYGLEALSDGYIADFLSSGRQYCTQTLRGELFSHVSVLHIEFKLAMPKPRSPSSSSPPSAEDGRGRGGGHSGEPLLLPSTLFPDLLDQEARCFYLAFFSVLKKVAPSTMTKSLEAGQFIVIPGSLVETCLDTLLARRFLPAYIRTFKVALQAWLDKVSSAATSDKTSLTTLVGLGASLSAPDSFKGTRRKSPEGAGNRGGSVSGRSGDQGVLGMPLLLKLGGKSTSGSPGGATSARSGRYGSSSATATGSPALPLASVFDDFLEYHQEVQGQVVDLQLDASRGGGSMSLAGSQSPHSPGSTTGFKGKKKKQSISPAADSREKSLLPPGTLASGPWITSSVGFDVLHALLFLSYHTLVHPLLAVSSSEAEDSGDLMTYEEAKLWGMTGASSLQRPGPG